MFSGGSSMNSDYASSGLLKHIQLDLDCVLSENVNKQNIFKIVTCLIIIQLFSMLFS